MPKYGNFENRTISLKWLPGRIAKISLISTSGYKKSTYATLGPVFKFQISCPNVEILKNGCKQLPVEQKLSSISTRGVERGSICNLWNFFQIPDFMPKYSNFDNHAVSWKWPQTWPRSFFHSFTPTSGMQILNLPQNSVFLFFLFFFFCLQITK